MTEAIRDLIEEWREFADSMDASDRPPGYAKGFDDAADELEGVLEKMEHERAAQTIKEVCESVSALEGEADD